MKDVICGRDAQCCIVFSEEHARRRRLVWSAAIHRRFEDPSTGRIPAACCRIQTGNRLLLEDLWTSRRQAALCGNSSIRESGDKSPHSKRPLPTCSRLVGEQKLCSIGRNARAPLQAGRHTVTQARGRRCGAAMLLELAPRHVCVQNTGQVVAFQKWHYGLLHDAARLVDFVAAEGYDLFLKGG
jgi:hypothetical protein